MDNYGKKENPNDFQMKAPEYTPIEGYNLIGRNYSPAWGGSFQSGGNMNYYKTGLDFTPKNISQNGSIIEDDMGQWKYPGEITKINSNNITMKGVKEKLLGISNKGDIKLMEPNKNYKFIGDSVTEIPISKIGGWLQKYK